MFEAPGRLKRHSVPQLFHNHTHVAVKCTHLVMLRAGRHVTGEMPQNLDATTFNGQDHYQLVIEAHQKRVLG